MITVAITVGLAVALYWYLTRTFDYWEKRGVKHDKPWPLLGTNAKNYFLKASTTKVASDTYHKYPGEKVVGFFRGSKPELVVRDLAIARRVLITDFSYFHRRGLFPTTNMEPMQKNQFASDDDLWRLLRLRMTPAFSSAKLKAMFPLIVDRAESLQDRLYKIVGKEQDARDLMARYTTDVIGTVGFGVVSNSLADDNTAFRQLGLKILTAPLSAIINLTLKTLLPVFFGHLKFFSKEIEGEVLGMVKSVMQQRNYEPSGRNDFIDLLIECKKKGDMIGDSIVETNADGTPKKVSIEMDDAILAAQSVVFFVAGFETSSSATSYTLHKLAQNPHIQLKAQQEIDRVLAQHNNKLSYDAISNMTYLRWCLDEGLRMFPSVGFVIRQCVRPYTFSDLNITIDPGVNIMIPLEAYQNDPKIFPEPKEYRPERFDPAMLTAEQKMAYMPFGEGPRACIGERLGLMQSMAGLAAVLAKFSAEPAPGAPREPVVNPTENLTQGIIGSLPLIFRERKV